MVLGRIYKQANPVFYAGLIVVVTGAVTVLVFRPAGAHAAAHETKVMETLEWAAVVGSVVMAAFCWGVYGPVLHKGQMAMAGSRLRPFICVGLAYFLIAVLVPLALLGLWHDPGNFNSVGCLWSLAGGTAGAIGALGVIMAFTFGGKPSYVMPIVFGGAPVINALVSMARAGTFSEASAAFYAGMFLVIAGAVTVLVFAPRGHHAPPQKAVPAH